MQSVYKSIHRSICIVIGGISLGNFLYAFNVFFSSNVRKGRFLGNFFYFEGILCNHNDRYLMLSFSHFCAELGIPHFCGFLGNISSVLVYTLGITCDSFICLFRLVSGGKLIQSA